MSRISIPVSGQMLYATGDVRLWANVTLAIRDGAGNFVNRRFRVDTGTDVTTYPAHDAQQLGLYLSPRPAAVRHEQTGLEVRSGMLSFRIDGMDPTLYAVSCFFLGDPNVKPSANVPVGRLPRMLLQPLALLEKLDFRMTKDPLAIAASWGELIIEKK